jgi:hypothetical protein
MSSLKLDQRNWYQGIGYLVVSVQAGTSIRDMNQSAELLAAIDKAGRVNALKAEGKARAKGCFRESEWFLARRATVKRPFSTLWGSYRSAAAYTTSEG